MSLSQQEEYKQLQQRLKNLDNETKIICSQIEEKETEIILAQKKNKLVEEKKKYYQKELEQIQSAEDVERQKNEINEKKQEIKRLQEEEEKLSIQLLPYLKFKIASSNIKPTQFYDMIVHCSSIVELLEQGWRIQFNREYTKNNNLNELINKFNEQSYQIGIIGDTDIGKSFFLYLICEKKFQEKNMKVPTGMAIPTKGLSVIKFEFEKGRWLDLLDSEGFHSPIQYEIKKVKGNLDEFQEIDNELQKLQNQMEEAQNQEEKQQFEERIQKQKEEQLNKKDIFQLNMQERQKKFNDRQVSEKLIQNYIIKSSSMIIIMVGDLSLNQQILVEQVTASQESKPIIVVHNMFKVQTFNQLQEKIKKNIDQSFQVEEQKYVTGFKYFVGIQRFQDIVKYREIFHIPFGYHASQELLDSIKQNSPEEFNELTKIKQQNYQALQFLQDKINFYYTKLSQLQRRSLTQSLKDFFAKNITDYLDLNVDQTNPNYKEFSQYFNNIEFKLKKNGNKEQSLYSTQLIQLNLLGSVNLKDFNFDSKNQIVNEPNQQMQCPNIFILNQRINPKYTLLITKQQEDNQKKMIFVWIEMPPVSQEDIDEILRCTSITKDNDSYILRMRNFKRSKEKLFKLFEIQNTQELIPSINQDSDIKNRYKLDGIVEIDIKLCQIRQIKVHNRIEHHNITVENGVVKFKIECEDFQQKNDQNDYYEDPNEIYLD